MSATSQTDYYQLLSIPATASAEEIQNAYDVLLQLYGLGSILTGTAREVFDHVTHAYNVLSDPRQRQQYDRLRTGTRLSSPGALSKHVRECCELQHKQNVIQGWLLGAMGIAILALVAAGMVLVEIGTP